METEKLSKSRKRHGIILSNQNHRTRIVLFSINENKIENKKIRLIHHKVAAQGQALNSRDRGRKVYPPRRNRRHSRPFGYSYNLDSICCLLFLVFLACNSVDFGFFPRIKLYIVFLSF